MTTLTDRLLIVAMSWAALLVFALLVRTLPKSLLPGNHAVSPLVWIVVGAVAVLSAVGILGNEPNSFYLIALVIVLVVYVGAVGVRRRQAGSRLNQR
jgi:O-antigen/teichoic acid export membrane protein